MTLAANIRIGLGHDTHRLVPGGPLRLGGVEIPFDRHLDGHSDADVLLHAITDALLGAVGAGDIGELFPNTAEENRGRDSTDFIVEANNVVTQRGFEIVNLDCIVFAEQPKLSGVKLRIASHIARLLNLSGDRVNVKAKTGEGLGTIGTMQVIEAQAIVLLAKRELIS